jgi:hypothetical protein
MLLYTLGCSFTYGQELPNPSIQSWPSLVADTLNYDLVNRGRPGCGNNYIVKTAMKEVPKLKPDLVIVAWTSCGRLEFSDRYGVFDIWAGCQRKWENPRPHRDDLIQYITSFHNDSHQYRNWLRQVILLQDFFKLRNINYLFLNTFDNQQLNRRHMKNSMEYVDLIDVDKFTGWPYHGTVDWTNGSKNLPGGHPSEEGHQLIKNAVIRGLTNAGHYRDPDIKAV